MIGKYRTVFIENRPISSLANTQTSNACGWKTAQQASLSVIGAKKRFMWIDCNYCKWMQRERIGALRDLNGGMLRFTSIHGKLSNWMQNSSTSLRFAHLTGNEPPVTISPKLQHHKPHTIQPHNILLSIIAFRQHSECWRTSAKSFTWK